MDQPVHPGKHLAESLGELGTSQRRLAKTVGVAPRRINEIVHGSRSVTADSALRIGRALVMSAELRLNLQSMYDLDVARGPVDTIGVEPLVAGNPSVVG